MKKISLFFFIFLCKQQVAGDITPLTQRFIGFLTDFRHDTPAGTIHFGQAVEAVIKTVLQYNAVHEEYSISLFIGTVLSGLYAPHFVLPKTIATGGRFLYNRLQKKIDTPIADDVWKNSSGVNYLLLRCCNVSKQQKKQYVLFQKEDVLKKAVIRFVDMFMDASLFMRTELDGKYDIKYQSLKKPGDFVTTPNNYPYRSPSGFFVHYAVGFLYDLMAVLTFRAAVFSLFYNHIYKRLLLKYSLLETLDKKVTNFFALNPLVTIIKKKSFFP